MESYFLYVANKFERLRLGETPPLQFPFLQELKTWPFWRAVLAEGVGTLLFVFIGCASAIQLNHPTVSATPDTAREVRIAFTFGLAIMVLVQMFGHVSGGHFNPAVSIPMAVIMKITPFRAVFYTVAQCCGGMLGGLILKGVTPSVYHSDLGVTSVNPDLTPGQGLGCEIIFTFILVFSILGTTDDNRPLFGNPALGIGLTVTAMHLAGVPYTGSSMNPARSLGSAVASDFYKHFWVYWIGPVLGGCAATVLYKWVFDPYRNAVPKEKVISDMLSASDMVAIPKDYFKEGDTDKDKSTTQM